MPFINKLLSTGQTTSTQAFQHSKTDTNKLHITAYLSSTHRIIFNHLAKVIYIINMHTATLLLLFALCCTAFAANTTYYLCPSDYFFDLQHCEMCAPNCICSSMGTCTSCIAGYTSYNGTCIQCPQASGIYGACSSCCSKTEGTQISCTDCQLVANSYTFLYSGRCIASPGCF